MDLPSFPKGRLFLLQHQETTASKHRQTCTNEVGPQALFQESLKPTQGQTTSPHCHPLNGSQATSPCPPEICTQKRLYLIQNSHPPCATAAKGCGPRASMADRLKRLRIHWKHEEEPVLCRATWCILQVSNAMASLLLPGQQDPHLELARSKPPFLSRPQTPPHSPLYRRRHRHRRSHRHL